MQSYLQQRTLQELGITYFDGWAADFGETVTSLEMAPSGQGYKAKTRFSKFTNLPELLTLYTVDVAVQVSKTFFAWIVGTQGKVKIKAPEKVVTEFSDFVAKIKEVY